MASSTEEYDSLHDNAPSNIIRVPVDIETISLTIDKFEDCYTNDDSGNSTIFQLILSEHSISSPSRDTYRDAKIHREMSENMGRIGDGIRTMSMIHARREIGT